VGRDEEEEEEGKDEEGEGAANAIFASSLVGSGECREAIGCCTHTAEAGIQRGSEEPLKRATQWEGGEAYSRTHIAGRVRGDDSPVSVRREG
jgi:hypothetical protein